MPTDVVGEHQPVHRTRHVHIGKDDVNADRLMFQNGERLTGMARFDHPKIRLFQSGDHGKANQCLVLDDDDNAGRGYRADHGSNTVWDDSSSPSRLPVDRWRDLSGPPSLAPSADAILDRLVYNAHRIGLAGDSLRRTRPRPVAKDWRAARFPLAESCFSVREA